MGKKGKAAGARPPLVIPAVYARVRPPAEEGGHAMPPAEEIEKRYGNAKRYKACTPSTVVIAGQSGDESFDFPTEVFDQATGQGEVFAKFAEPSVAKFAKEGYNALIFAYGQTGTGKTHTILGPETSWGAVDGHEDWGIFPKAVEYTFEALRETGGAFSLAASALQFYLADCQDLLDDDLPRVAISNQTHEPLGLTEVPLRALADLVIFMAKVQRNRTTRSTRMNRSADGQHSGSSRAHATLILTLRRLVDGGKLLITKLHCVDLAGAERPDSVGAGRSSGYETLMEIYSGRELSTAAQGYLINYELHLLRTEIVKARDSWRKGRKPVVSGMMSTAAVHYFLQSLTGIAVVSAVVCLSPTPQNGWETWFACTYGTDIKKMRMPVAPRKAADREAWLRRAEAEVAQVTRDLANTPKPTKPEEYHWGRTRFWLLRAQRIKGLEISIAAVKALE